MPPKLIDGNWILPHGGRLIFEDGSPVVITEAEIPPEPGWEPPHFGLHEFSVDIPLSLAETKRIIKFFHAAVNRQKRAVRTAKRQREKERRRRLKEANNG